MADTAAINYTDEQLDAMKVVELKEALKQHGLSTTGNKPELYQRLKDARDQAAQPAKEKPAATAAAETSTAPAAAAVSFH